MSNDDQTKRSATEFELDNDELKTIVQTFVQETTLLPSPPDEDASNSAHTGLGPTGQRYTIGNILGAGGMGIVLQAHDKNLDRAVAMKVLQKARVKDSSHALRFIREAEITGTLEHPNIIPLHELGLDAGNNAYYTMKQVKGETLKAILKQLNAEDPTYLSNYPFQRLLEIFLKVCDAISLAHSQGVIHRDLKPENIMVGDFGEVLVIDWGLAKQLDSEEECIDDEEDMASRVNPAELVTQAGAVMGTPGYMSPEQVRGHNVGKQSDVFSLGAILYSILTFKPPVSGKTIRELVTNLLKGNIKSPEESWKSRSDGQKPQHLPGGTVPAGISAVTMKALASHLNDRYSSVDALKLDIENFQDGYITGAEKASLIRKLWLVAKRHSKSAAAIVIISTLLAIYGAFFTSKLNHETTITQEHQEATEVALALVDEKRQAALTVFSNLKRKCPILVQQARNEMASSNFVSALALINNAIFLSPDDGDLYQLKGDILQNQFEFERAEKAYSKALQLKGSIPGLVESKAICAKFAATVWPSSTERLKALNRHMVEVGRYRESLNLLAQMEYNVDDYFVSGKAYAESKGWNTQINVSQNSEDWNVRYHKGGNGIYMYIKRCGSYLDLREISGLGVSHLKINRPIFVTGWEALSSQKSLNTLEVLEATQLDLANLRGLKLHTLTVHSDEVKNLDLIGDMEVTFLTLTGKGITDDAVAGLNGEGITNLNLQYTGLTNLNFLENFPSLTHLRISGRTITSLPLSHLSLSYLDLSCFKLTSLDGINPSSLRHLRISSTPINNLEYFRKHEFPLLKKLYISWCPVSDISPLKNLAQLNELSIFDTRVSDLAPLTGHRLNRLDFRSTGVTDLTPLKECAPKHIELSMRGLSDANIDFLKSLKIRTINGRKAGDYWRKYDETNTKRK